MTMEERFVLEVMRKQSYFEWVAMAVHLNKYANISIHISLHQLLSFNNFSHYLFPN